MSLSFRFLVLRVLPVLAVGPLFVQAESSTLFRNADLPIEQRVEDLLSRMTVEEKIGQTMMASPEIPRLGIERYDWWNEALHGVGRNGIATVFPQAIGLAATWNPSLHEKIGFFPFCCGCGPKKQLKSKNEYKRA